ncbi:MAG TPA: hypothetical protein VK883_07575, partial [Arthrobacter sp.]|nr:hypothetical protein [Arthrobacter sp.]
MVDQPVDGVYPEYWEADVVLRDGGTAHLRPIHPSDADAVQTFHVGQSQKSIYMRFFAFKSKLSAKELKRFTEVDYKDRVALVITIGGEIMGMLMVFSDAGYDVKRHFDDGVVSLEFN